MKEVLYLLFGLAVVGGYAYMNLRGIDPFATKAERSLAPPAAVGAGAAGLRSYRYGRSSGFRPGK